MSVYDQWERYHIKTNQDLARMQVLFLKDQPKTGGWDTESTGLHIIKDKPFLIQFGWLIPGQDGGRVFTFEPKKEFMELFFSLARELRYMVAHNIK
jgi:DNA polymerase I